MDHAIAKVFMQHYMKMNDVLNDATRETFTLDEEDSLRIRKILGWIGQEIYLELMRPIIKEHPDLDPD